MGEDKPRECEDGSNTEEGAGREGNGGKSGNSGGEGSKVGNGGVENGVGEGRGGRGPCEEGDEEGEEEWEGIAEEGRGSEAHEKPGSEGKPGGVPVVGPGKEAGSAGGDGEQRGEVDEGVCEDEGDHEEEREKERKFIFLHAARLHRPPSLHGARGRRQRRAAETV